VEVKLANAALARLEYRKGYYSEKEFKAFNSSEKEKQLEDALLLGDPLTQLPLALEINYFRLSRDRYLAPVSVKIPGSAVPYRKKGGRETTEFDFIAEVRDEKNARVSMVRDGIRVRLPEAGQGGHRSLLYETAFTLSPGSYRVKLLARENESGLMGTFETRFQIAAQPAAPTAPLISTVVWSGQREALQAAVGSAGKLDGKRARRHPLVSEGQKLIPSVTRVFRQDQPLYIYCEVYDPVRQQGGGPSVAATVSLFRAGRKVAESEPAHANGLLPDRNNVAGLSLQMPLKDVPPGRYEAQLNIIDEAGRKFAFERGSLVIRAADKTATAAIPSTLNR